MQTSIRFRDNNPSVVLKPLLKDQLCENSPFNALPASAVLFNKPDMSDVKLKVNNTRFFAHRNLLSAASEVFASMFGGNWAESNNSLLELTEDPDCAKYFDRFLYFIYSGTVTLTSVNIVALFMLADKYDVAALYGECYKNIEYWLKVFVVPEKRSESFSAISDNAAKAGRPIKYGEANQQLVTDADDEEIVVCKQFSWDGAHCKSLSSDHKSRHQNDNFLSGKNIDLKLADRSTIIPVEIFSIATILKLLQFCHDDRMRRAALFNLEARIGNQIYRHKHCDCWVDLDLEVVLEMLGDDRFCYPEYMLFQAAISWLKFKSERLEPKTIVQVLSLIRYPLLSPPDLFEVFKSSWAKNYPKVMDRVNEAVQYQLFRHFVSSLDDNSNWSGKNYTRRYIDI